MADIFISYKSDDREKAKQFANAFTRAGMTVWWDAQLRTGEAYDEVIDRELNSSNCVVVLWSEASVKSRWVRAEANIAERRGILLPTRIDETEPPLQFQLIQTADMSSWNGDPDAPIIHTFISMVKDALGRTYYSYDESPSQTGTLPSAESKPFLERFKPKRVDVDIESEFWHAIADSPEQGDLNAFLKRFPEGRYKKLAEKRLNELSASTSDQSIAQSLLQMQKHQAELQRELHQLRSEQSNHPAPVAQPATAPTAPQVVYVKEPAENRRKSFGGWWVLVLLFPIAGILMLLFGRGRAADFFLLLIWIGINVAVLAAMDQSGAFYQSY